MERMIKRGDIFYAELNPVIGSEQGGTRPVLVISNNTGNRHSPTVIIAPITSRTHTKAKLPTHTEVKDFEKLDKDSIILLEQIRTIDKQRLKNHIGMMPDNVMARVNKALDISLSMKQQIAGRVTGAEWGAGFCKFQHPIRMFAVPEQKKINYGR